MPTSHSTDTPKISHPGKRAFLASYTRCCNISLSAKRAKIDRRTHYDWLANDPEYKIAFFKAHIEAVDALEDQVVKLGYEGNITALIFRLKGERPDKYRENVKHSGTGPGGSIEMSHGLSTPAERILAELRGIAARIGAASTDSADPGS